ncbi:MAG: TraR/DksA family transcriptional regulator [Bacteroidales bacterium]|nr:TraR/DksA family transcriptional regulator [Bacteroidales bacterium]MBD5216270.1 TraR/DksA family transcriptional regulator [Bacteroidales bacterium]MBD5218669.1 TraR/DksA family transcriptional regulator [Bacteroidales bacterium]MDE6437555.1 TraR/DksA family transcriptional regulator [Muribaculaceae bacterium]
MSEHLRYSDEELEEFRQIILEKLAKATELYEDLCSSLNNSDGNDTADTSPTFKALEEGSNVLEREANARLAERQRQFISHLRAALVRIDNKTYGICRATGRLIPKARLRAVPHATLCVEEKNNNKDH